MKTERSGKITNKEIRDSLAIYPDRKFNIWRFLLESVALSLEVFLHTRLGQRYLSIPKAIGGSIFIYLSLFLTAFGFSVAVTPDVTQIGGVSLLKSFVESLLSFDWEGAGARLRNLYLALSNPETRFDVLGPVQFMVVAFSLMVNLQLILGFSCRHKIPPSLWHPRSSGEPWFIWNWVYRLGHRFNFRVDIVKQFGEPLLCFVLAWLVLLHLPKEWHFLSAWLKMGAIALLIRTYLENRDRDKFAVDRLANQFDARAFELQDEIYTNEPTGENFGEARGLD